MPRMAPPTDTPPSETPAEDQPERSVLEWALYWAENGWPVFPLRPKDKIPLFPSPHKKGVKCDGQCGLTGHGVLDATRDPETIRKWWSANPNAGIGGSTLDRVVLDFDIQHGAERRGILPPTREHLSGRGNGNVHVIYRAGGDSARALGPGTNILGKGIDIRAGAGAYVVLPPSLHPESLKPYTVANGEEEHFLSDDDIDTIWGGYDAKQSATVKGAKKGISAVPKTPKAGGGAGVGGRLSELLANPPARGTGETNSWLTKVAGHLAKMHRDKRDLYEQMVRDAAAKVDPDYEDTDKVLESVWATEQASHQERDLTDAGGYLVGTGFALFCQAKVSDGDGGSEMGLLPYGDFDVRAQGVMVDEDHRRAYQVTLYARGVEIETTLSPEVLADTKRLATWLARYGATIAPPATAWPQMAAPVRLQRYLESQRPATVRVVPHLGWDGPSGQFVTLDGSITRDGPLDVHQAGVIADRDKISRKTAKAHYGFEGSWEVAQEVLREVQTYHFDETVYLFGAFWASCFLKPQAMEYTSLFPFFGVEGVSGSGKTNGYFQCMVQLNGNYRGTVLPTTASFRDMTISNANGIVWADDLNDPQRLEEILRAATSGGTVTKMDEDRRPKDFQVVAPLLFSGEALGFQGQKALMDRGIVINPQPPVNRTSQKEGREGKSQYDDVKALQRRFAGDYGLAVLAGWFVQESIRVQDRYLVALAEARKATGRRGEKYAVFSAGARLLDHFQGYDEAWEGEGPTAQYVDAWVADRLGSEVGREDDSVLTTRLLPWALQQWGRIGSENPTLVDYRSSRSQVPPVLIQGDPDAEGELVNEWCVLVNVPALARAWEEYKGGRVDYRLESQEGLARQIQQVGPNSKENGARVGRRIGGRVTVYRALSSVYSNLVLDRAEGDLTG